MNVTALVGGVGGAKLAYGLTRLLPPDDLRIVVNTGDDFQLYGLTICPDLDTVMYTLAGMVDPVNGWGLQGDSIQALESLRRYGDEAWFRLGDKDIATHLLRSEGLRRGETLTSVMARLAGALGVHHPILPMSDSPVPTMVDTVEQGELAFQVYFVKQRWQPTVRGLRFAGADTAQMTDAVREAITQADVLLIAPSNPWLSIDPILALPEMRRLIMRRDIPRVAVSPIVGGQAVKGPAAKMMKEMGFAVSAGGVAAYYGDLLNGFVHDVVDGMVSAPQAHVLACDTIMDNAEKKVMLARTILDWILTWI